MLRDSLQRRCVSPILEKCILAARNADRLEVDARLTAESAEKLGVVGVAVLVVRPDGHIGLRADRDPLQALDAYQRLLTSGR